MKKIFHGVWTWNRSGIIVEIDGYRIAASMNGKPHGAGKIEGSNFPGHFCIHFLNSTTHSGNMDERHHEEILKAAGKLPLKEAKELKAEEQASEDQVAEDQKAEEQTSEDQVAKEQEAEDQVAEE